MRLFNVLFHTISSFCYYIISCSCKASVIHYLFISIIASLLFFTSRNQNSTYVLFSILESCTSVPAEKYADDKHSPITYPIGVIKSSKNPDIAKAFEDFLFTDTCKTIFEKYGYGIA